MYGFVNQAIRELIIGRFGEEAWARVSTSAGASQCPFISAHIYDDSLTYDLVGAVAAELQVSVPEALEAFGEYWVEFVEAQGFGPLLASSGSDLKEFLGNLDQFHARLATSYPKCEPPRFEFSELENDQVELLYSSERPGLAPMVYGIIKGLSKWFDTPVEVEFESGDASARFLISIGEPAGVNG